MTEPDRAAPANFLIVRLSAIGDAIHTLPLAAALKKLHPGCRLGWVVEKPAAPLVESNPLVDWSYALPKGWLKSPGTVKRLLTALRRERFDICFDVQGLTKSAVVALLSGAKKRVGFRRGEGRELAPFMDNVLVEAAGVHAVDKTLSLLAGVGDPVPERPEFVFPPCPEADKAVIDDFLAGFPADNGFCLMGPWGSFAAKRWPLDRFVVLAEMLRHGAGLRSVVLGHGREERDLVRRAIDGSVFPAAFPAAVQAPDVSVAGVVELARRARLFVGCDSFPMHAADGVGCPTIGLFGVTDPNRLGPRGKNSRSVFASLTLVKSTRERRRLDAENMAALKTGDVAAECFKTLKGLKPLLPNAGNTA